MLCACQLVAPAKARTRGNRLKSLDSRFRVNDAMSGIVLISGILSHALRRPSTTIYWRTAMRLLFILGISLLVVSACTPQPAPPPAVAGQPITPVSYASGSPANTTRDFDGTFTGRAVQSVAGGGITPGASTASVNCPNYTVASLPPLTISNGLAQFQAIGLTFQGYVTPQGGLMMSSGVGQTFQGQIDRQNVLSGQVLGRCAYNLSWQKSA